MSALLNAPVRELLIGQPGSGKTGSLAALANAGYKIRLIDLDGNLESLTKFTSTEGRSNVDVISLRERFRRNKSPTGKRALIIDGAPTVFDTVLDLLDDWEGKGPIGDAPEGSIYVLDGLAQLARAAFRRTVHASGRGDKRPTFTEWERAQDELATFLDLWNAPLPYIKCHRVVTSHMKLMGPDYEDDDDEEDDDKSKIRVEVAKAKVTKIPFRWYPLVIGRVLAPSVGGFFGCTVLAETKVIAGRPKRMLITVPRDDIDVKVPAEITERELPIETGQLTIFEALTGGLKDG